MFSDISALNDLSGISLILHESFPKEGSHIRVLERIFEDSILSRQTTNEPSSETNCTEKLLVTGHT